MPLTAVQEQSEIMYTPPKPLDPPRVRTPREIMKDRNAREARKRKESEQSGQIQKQVVDNRRADSGRVDKSRVGKALTEEHYPRKAQSLQNLKTSNLGRNEEIERSQALEKDKKTENQAVAGVSRAKSQSIKDQNTSVNRQKNPILTFPHAFERWEALSSHWEGITSFWVRKLESNKASIAENIPAASTMTRQITDLSAAGANLFHAVVELQRLRASSERKFQRWFYETRAEQEGQKESQASLQKALETERSEKEELSRLCQRSIVDRDQIEQTLKIMRREVQISRDEASRAWEELGRREEAERERTANLKAGIPTVIGGIQVVPMHTTIPFVSQDARSYYALTGSFHDDDNNNNNNEHDDTFSHEGQTQIDTSRPDTANTNPFSEDYIPRYHRETIHSSVLKPPSHQSPDPITPHLQVLSTNNSPPSFIPASHQKFDTKGPSDVTSTVEVQQSLQSALPGQHSTFMDESHHNLQDQISGTMDHIPITPIESFFHNTDSATDQDTEYELDSNGHVRRDDHGQPIIWHPREIHHEEETCLALDAAYDTLPTLEQSPPHQYEKVATDACKSLEKQPDKSDINTSA